MRPRAHDGGAQDARAWPSSSAPTRFRSDDAETNAVGLLHEEMRRAGSLIMARAMPTSCPPAARSPSTATISRPTITRRLEEHPLVTIARGEVAGLPPADWDSVIIATGPLTSPALAAAIQQLTGESRARLLRRHRADRAPASSIDDDHHLAPVALRQGRARRHRRRLHQLPDDASAEYEAFIDALLAGEKTSFKEWEASTPYFDGCLPIEVMAERGRETLRFGPMKPVGLTNPHRPGERPYAVVQLRQDNALGTLWNMVGFQTKLKHGEQARIFRMIPGLENAEFARLGGLHRNTFLNSPKLLDGELRLQSRAAAAVRRADHGLRGLRRERRHRPAGGRARPPRSARASAGLPPPPTTAFGALLGHITGGHLCLREEAGARCAPSSR